MISDISRSLDPLLEEEALSEAGGDMGRELVGSGVFRVYSLEKHMASGTQRPQSFSRNPYLQ